MNISLISVDNDVAHHGLRAISSLLKSRGHKVKLIFLTTSNKITRGNILSSELYPQNIIDQVKELTKDSKIVGVTSMALTAERAKQIFSNLKDKILLWGGSYPTMNPDKCIEVVDYVFRGESELALLEFVEHIEQNKDVSEIKNLWVRKDGIVIKNELRPLNNDLDALPIPDYGCKDHYVQIEGNIVNMKEEYFFEKYKENMALLFTQRGCPYTCSFCSNHTFNELYSGKFRIVRKKSIKYVINELLEIKKNLPSVNKIWFTDDCLVMRSYEDLKLFNELYKKHINLSFRCYGIAKHIVEDKLGLLVDAGLKEILVGVQSGSERTLKYYNRPIFKEDILKASKVINKFKDKLMPRYELIYSNPYEQKEDLLTTIDLARKLPEPFRLDAYNLVFFPGIALYNKAKEDGTIKEEEDAGYESDYFNATHHIKKSTNIYLNNLIFWISGVHKGWKSGKIPKFFLKLLLMDSTINFFEKYRRIPLFLTYLYSVPGNIKLRIYNSFSMRNKIRLKNLLREASA